MHTQKILNDSPATHAWQQGKSMQISVVQHSRHWAMHTQDDTQDLDCDFHTCQ